MTAISFTLFRDKILSGAKNQTIREVRKKYPIKVGNLLHLYWHQRLPDCEFLYQTVCTSVDSIKITETEVYYRDSRLESSLDDFAIADGFDNFNHMRDWFKQKYRLPFVGVLIKWEPKYMQAVSQKN